MKLPWEPIFTIERSNLPEVTIEGIISVVDLSQDKPKAILSVGQTEALTWTRSLLKPWQLLSHYPDLKQNYPQLLSHHLAVMLSSHNGEARQLECVREILSLGDVPESDLKCPACYPMSDEVRFQLQAEGKQPQAIYNPCSGKHSGYLLDLKARQEKLDNYLDPKSAQFEPLREILSFVLNKPSKDFPATTDGCLLPNYATSSMELAYLYGLLAKGLSPEQISTAPTTIKALAESWNEVSGLMPKHPAMVGGKDRLDTKLMQGELTSDKNLTINAKEGAQGLLGVGISNSERYPGSLGILVKLSSGWNPHYMEIAISLVLEQLGIRAAAQLDHSPHLKTLCHFQIPAYQKV